MESFALNSSTMSFQAMVSTLPKAFMDYILAHSEQLPPHFSSSSDTSLKHAAFQDLLQSVQRKAGKVTFFIFLYSDVRKQRFIDILFTFFFFL